MKPFSRVVESIEFVAGLGRCAIVRGVRLVELRDVGECEVASAWEIVRAPLRTFSHDAEKAMAAARESFRATFLADDEAARARRAVLRADAQRRAS